MLSERNKYVRRQERTRFKLSKRRNTAPRLSVFRSNNHIYAQVIDDANRKTLVSASTMDKALRKGKMISGNKDAAAAVGKLVAERAKEKGIKAVVFDRGGCVYHGRVKALGDAARENGLKF